MTTPTIGDIHAALHAFAEEHARYLRVANELQAMLDARASIAERGPLERQAYEITQTLKRLAVVIVEGAHANHLEGAEDLAEIVRDVGRSSAGNRYWEPRGAN